MEEGLLKVGALDAELGDPVASLEDVLEEGFGFGGRNDQLALLGLRGAHARVGAPHRW
jgi:hypothetical protein